MDHQRIRVTTASAASVPGGPPRVAGPVMSGEHHASGARAGTSTLSITRNYPVNRHVEMPQEVMINTRQHACTSWIHYWPRS